MGGRGSAAIRGSGENKVQSRLKEIENQEYQYHATQGTSIWSIYEQGLKPNRGHAGSGIYFAPSEKDALEWTELSSTGGKTLLRVKTKTLKDKYSWGVLDESESIADKKISTKDIEIRTGGGTWMSFDEYREKRGTSYRMWKNRR